MSLTIRKAIAVPKEAYPLHLALLPVLVLCLVTAGSAAGRAAEDRDGGAGPALAQVEEGDIDESFEAYGDDSDEIFEDDEALRASVDTLLEGITWLGHASFLVESERNIYIDPYDLPPQSADSLPKADLILVTHDHSDHFSTRDIAMIAESTTVVVSIEAVLRDLPARIRESRTVAPGDTVSVRGIVIEAVPAYNIVKEYHPRDRGYVGFVVHLKDRTVYHAGDTDVIPEMEGIDADVALLPIGGKFTMNAVEAARAVEIIDPKVAVPMHWGKFIGTWEDAKTFQARSKSRVVVLTEMARRPGK